MYPFITYVPCSNDDLFTLIIGFRVGAIHETKQHAGISHLLEHMVFKRDFPKYLNYMNQIGATWNAETHRDVTLFYINCNIKHARKCVQLLVRLTRSSIVISKPEFEKERQIVIEELSLFKIDTRPIFKMAHKNSIYGNTIVGSEESIKSITLEDLNEYHKIHYSEPIIVYGCNKKYQKTVQSWFGESRNQSIPMNIDMNKSVTFDKSSRIIQKPSHAESCELVWVGFPSQDPRSLSLKILAFAIKGLMLKKAREEKNMVYVVRATYIQYAHTGIFFVTFESKYFLVTDVLKILVKELKNMTNNLMAKYAKEYEQMSSVESIINPFIKCKQALQNILYGEPYYMAPYDLHELLNFDRLVYICKTVCTRQSIDKLLQM